MSIQLKGRTLFYTTIAILVLLLLSGFGVVSFFSQQARIRAQERQLLAMTEQGQQFTQTIDELGKEVSEQKQLIISNEKLLKDQDKTLQDLKNIQSQTIIKTRTEFKDTLYIPFATHDTILAADTIDGYIPVPQAYAKADTPWYSLGGTVTKTGLIIDHLTFDNKQTITIADKKLGFFKSPEPIVRVTNDNPYTTVTGLNNTIVLEPTPFYKKPWFWFVVGIGSKVALDEFVFKPK